MLTEVSLPRLEPMPALVAGLGSGGRFGVEIDLIRRRERADTVRRLYLLARSTDLVR